MNLVPLRLRSAVALGAVFAVGVVAFGWPFFTTPGAALDTSHSGDAPMVFVLMLPLLAAVVLAELTSGGMDAKAVAMLGMLAAVPGPSARSRAEPASSSTSADSTERPRSHGSDVVT